MIGKSGNFIVIEGPDGSGKRTQQESLIAALLNMGYEVSRISFPQYETSLFGGLVGKMLNGEFGSMGGIDPHLASVVFAADRWKASETIKSDLSHGKIVVADRYTLSNMAHQAARLPEDKRETFLNLLEKMEYDPDEGFGIPKPDIYIHLHVPIEISQKLILEKAQRVYLDGQKDQLEADVSHQVEASKMYHRLSETMDGIVTIDCCDLTGNLMPIETIHGLVLGKVVNFLDPELKEGISMKERRG